MKTIKEIQKEQIVKLSALFKELGIFFAFSQEQFNEQKKEGVVYVSGDFGMVLPAENVKAYYDRHKKLIDEETEELKANVPMDDYIRYQLANHECFFTGDYEEILEFVQAFYTHCTMEDIRRVYYKYVNEEIQN